MRVVITGAGGFIGRSLAAEILERGALRSQTGAETAIEELVLVDRAPIEPPASGRLRTTCLAGDLCDPAFLQQVVRPGVDSLFHLAATLTVEAERDVDAGWDVNLRLPHRLLDTLRASGRAPRFVHASSIAVFGGTLPETVADNHVRRPTTSYGTAKAVTELLIDDYARHGFVDGRALRLPVVVIRPGRPTGAVSDIIASLVREPLRGAPVRSPLGRDARFPVASVGRIAENLLRVHDAPAAAFGESRAVNQPGLTVSVGDIVAALGRVAGPDVAARVSIDPVEAIERILAGWPLSFVTEVDLRPPLQADVDFDSIIRDYLRAHPAAPAAR